MDDERIYQLLKDHPAGAKTKPKEEYELIMGRVDERKRRAQRHWQMSFALAACLLAGIGVVKFSADRAAPILNDDLSSDYIYTGYNSEDPEIDDYLSLADALAPNSND